jgi:SAM-dependent methyltransferase
MNTDKTWRWYGDNDPYYGVLTDDAFRGGNLTSEHKAAFFESGQKHITQLLSELEAAQFSVGRIKALDFGCGVGRLVIPLARDFESVVGIDVSEGMLKECAKNASEMGLQNIRLVLSDDQLSALEDEKFDLVHSFIVLQHIPYERGLDIFRRLLDLVKPGGVACLHVQYAGFPLVQGFGLKTALRRMLNKLRDKLIPPEQMLMNAYPLNAVFGLLDRQGFSNCRVVFTRTTRGGVFIWAQRGNQPAIF